jgi:hypothetical protein
MWYIGILILLHVAKPAKLRSNFAKTIAKGDVFSVDQWIPLDQVEKLSKMCVMIQTDGLFQSSGITYADSSDSSSDTPDRLVCDEIPRKYLDGDTFSQLTDQIEHLRWEISALLNRPTMKLDDLPHESYLSLSLPGADLKRHMDEKHEELKSSKRWGLQTRRSISWLLYLNDMTWDPIINGGELRCFRQKGRLYPSYYGKCGCHEGNIQVGWLEKMNYTKPVYMQTWSNIPQYSSERDISDFDNTDAAVSALYVLSIFKRKIFITSKFIANEGNEVQTEKSDNLLPRLNFLEKCKKYMLPRIVKEGMLSSFSLIENYASWLDDARDGVQGRSRAPFNTESVEVVPRGGTLCLFDSVSLPHEVLPTYKGKRLAVAGWFHEVVTPMTDSTVHLPPHLESHCTVVSDITRLNTAVMQGPVSVEATPNTSKVMISALKAMSYRTKS